MSLLNRPNHVIEHQRYFQQPSNKLLFHRGPRDKYFVAATLLILGTGLTGAVWGAIRMARGTKD